MRIAFYAPMKPPGHPVPSGDRRMAQLMLAALSAAGHAADLASEFRSYDARGDRERQRRLAAAAGHEAGRLIARFRAADAAPDLWFTYHVYHKAPDWLGPPVSRALDIPYAIAEPSFAPKQAEGPWAVGHGAAGAAIAQADALFCLTRLDMEQVGRLARPGRLHYLPPFLGGLHPLPPATGRTALRAALAARHGLDPGTGWLLAVGMMRRRDKLESYRRLADALHLLSGLPWQLLIAGDGEARAEVEQAFAPFAGRTRLLGALPPDGLPALYAACDIYVWPAAGEAYGMALLEAQAAGLPVVAGRVRGVPDVVIEGETALLAREADPADFANLIALLIRDPERRRQLAGRAARFAREDRSLARAADDLDRHLAPLLRRPRR